MIIGLEKRGGTREGNKSSLIYKDAIIQKSFNLNTWIFFIIIFNLYSWAAFYSTVCPIKVTHLCSNLLYKMSKYFLDIYVVYKMGQDLLDIQ